MSIRLKKNTVIIVSFQVHIQDGSSGLDFCAKLKKKKTNLLPPF